MEVKLIVQSGRQAGKVIPVSGPKFFIGRADECHLRAQSTLISRKHTAIFIEEGSVSVEDCGSTNGTFLNDEPVKQRSELHSGDHLRVGPLAFEVQLSTGLAARKRPKVRSVQEAAARTAAAAPPTPADEFDISGWLTEPTGADETHTRRASEPTTETIIGRGLTDTASMTVASSSEKKPQEKKQEKQPPTKGSGKFQLPPKRMAETSGAAAEDALRQFFQRRKP